MSGIQPNGYQFSGFVNDDNESSLTQSVFVTSEITGGSILNQRPQIL